MTDVTVDEQVSAQYTSVLRRNPRMYWLFWAGPPLLLMAIIFASGTDRGASTQSQSLIEALLSRWAPRLYADLTPFGLEMLNITFRKVVHFSVYAVLVVLDARALHGARGVFTRREARLGFTAAVGWAAVDEFHQSFFASRGGSPYDVALDAVGATFGIFAYSFWARWRPR